MIRKLVSETVLYGGTTILVRLISYALTPLHTSVFAPASFGIISEFYAYAVAANVIYTYGMETAFFRFATKDKDQLHFHFSNALSTLIFSSIILSFCLYVFSEDISIALGHGEEGAKYVTWFAILFAVDAIVAIPFARLRLLHKAKKFALIKIINAVLILALNAFFLFFCKDVYEGKYLQDLKPFISEIYDPTLGLGYTFLANLIANVLLIPMHADAFFNFKLRLNFTFLKPAYIYGYPIMLSGLAFAINEAADRIFIKYLLPDNFYDGETSEWAVGVYAACYKLSIFITMAIQAFKYAAEPFFFSRAKDKNAPATYALILDYFIVFCCLVILLVMANISFLSSILIPNEAYWVGLPIVPFLLFANLFLGVYYNLSVWFKLTDRTIYGAYMSMIGAVITISLNILLIPLVGYFGSAIATFTCYFSIATISYLWGKKYFEVPYNIKSALTNLIVTAALLIGVFNLELSNTLLELLIKNLLVLVFLLFLYFKYKGKISSLMSKVEKR